MRRQVACLPRGCLLWVWSRWARVPLYEERCHGSDGKRDGTGGCGNNNDRFRKAVGPTAACGFVPCKTLSHNCGGARAFLQGEAT